MSRLRLLGLDVQALGLDEGKGMDNLVDLVMQGTTGRED